MKFLDDIFGFAGVAVFNPWREIDNLDISHAAPQDRRARLIAHFTCSPKFLLIGEAPGYRGCHFSGVPFTSEATLLEGIPRVTCDTRITTGQRLWTEASATIVWRTLRALGIADQIVMWNAFPWHPHTLPNIRTNRTPTPGELHIGQPILRAVIDHFSGVPVLAIGRQAEWLLKQSKITPAAVLRHPSMGGGCVFAEGLQRFIESKAA